MKTYMMLVGAPCSGKSTFYRKFADSNPDKEIVYISSDFFIEKKALADHLTYQEGFALYVTEAARSMNELFQKTIKQDSFFIVHDQTNMTARKRISFLKQLPKGTNKICQVFIEDKAVLMQRNFQRHVMTGKSIPDSVIENMLNSYEEPTYDEGWDVIWKG